MNLLKKFNTLLLLIIPTFLFSQGFESNLASDTLKVKSSKFEIRQNQVVKSQWIKGAIVPASLILAGTITLIPESNTLLSKYSIRKGIQDAFSGAKSPVDNYLQFAPLAAVFGLRAIGVPSRSDMINQFVISVKAELLMNILVEGMKKMIPTRRPSGGMNSMPSGHTAQAFVSATILDMEYRDTSPWISVAGYAAATTTGMYRMINDKHWISDVFIGAGIGILSTRLVYLTHCYRCGKKGNLAILPAILKNGGGVSMALVL